MNDVFEELDKPAYPGQVREKRWRFLIQPEAGGGERWMKRFQDYWARQERRFGLEFDERMVIGVDREAGVIVSQVMVRRLKPGKRIPKAEVRAAPVALQ